MLITHMVDSFAGCHWSSTPGEGEICNKNPTKTMFSTPAKIALLIKVVLMMHKLVCSGTYIDCIDSGGPQFQLSSIDLL